MYALVTAAVVLYATAFIMIERWVHRADPPGVAREFVDTGAYTLSYLRGGPPDAPRIIYVHGTPGSAHDFARYLTDPVDGYESISVDRPGFGQTRPARAEPRLHEQAAALAPLLVARDGRRPILVGHSLGGPIVLQAALDFPERIGGLVLLAPAVDPALERVAWYQRAAEFSLLPWLIPPTLRHTNREVIPLAAELTAMQPRLSDLHVPVMVLHAPDDSLVPFENVTYLKRHLPDATKLQIIELPGKDHFLPWNSEAAVRDAIGEILRRSADDQ